MSDPYLGEIRLFGGNYAPQGWNLCDGTILPISTNPSLFSLIGTTYGGDGNTTFALPDLRGRVPMHRQDPQFPLGQAAGSEAVALAANETPSHNHQLYATGDAAGVSSPLGAYVATSSAVKIYEQTNPTLAFDPTSVVMGGGGGTPHPNMQPFQVVTYIICLNGIFPDRG